MLHIEELSRHHRRSDFDCGDQFLNGYFKNYAMQDQGRGLARCRVLVDADADSSAAIGFYTLSQFALPAGEFPRSEAAGRLPAGRLIPVSLLGRLAVAVSRQRQHFGAMLLIDAVGRARLAAAYAGSVALVVDAKPGAIQFYVHFGFRPLSGEANRLYLALKNDPG